MINIIKYHFQKLNFAFNVSEFNAFYVRSCVFFVFMNLIFVVFIFCYWFFYSFVLLFVSLFFGYVKLLGIRKWRSSQNEHGNMFSLFECLKKICVLSSNLKQKIKAFIRPTFLLARNSCLQPRHFVWSSSACVYNWLRFLYEGLHELVPSLSAHISVSTGRHLSLWIFHEWAIIFENSEQSIYKRLDLWSRRTDT